MTRLTGSLGGKVLAGAIAAFAALAAPAGAGAQDLRIGVATHPKTMDVQKETGNDAAQFLYNIYDTLIERDPFATPLKFQPGLAVSWKQTSATVWELKLRDSVIMHDGSKLTANDVQYSLDRVFKRTDPRFGSAHGRFFYNFSHVEVVNPLTVRIHTFKPEPLFEVLMSARNAGITSKAHVDKLGLDKAMLQPVGSGPYKVVKLDPGRETILARHDAYWGKKAPLKSVRYIRIRETSARITALVNGEVDLITSVPPDQEKLVPTARFKRIGTTWPMFHVMVLKMTDPVLKDARIRQAMNLAIDREKLTKALWGGRGLAAKAHQFPEYGAPLYIPNLVTIKHDPAKARALIKAAGYKGETIRITFQPGYYLYFDLAAQAVQEMWQSVGLKVAIEQTEKYEYPRVMVRPWSNPMYYPDPMGAFDTHWSAASWTTKRKFFAPQSPQWKALYEKARFATDPAVRRDAYKELVTLGEQEAGWVLLYQPYESFAMRKDIAWKIPTALRPYTLPLRDGQITLGAK